MIEIRAEEETAGPILELGKALQKKKATFTLSLLFFLNFMNSNILLAI